MQTGPRGPVDSDDGNVLSKKQSSPVSTERNQGSGLMSNTFAETESVINNIQNRIRALFKPKTQHTIQNESGVVAATKVTSRVSSGGGRGKGRGRGEENP